MKRVHWLLVALGLLVLAGVVAFAIDRYRARLQDLRAKHVATERRSSWAPAASTPRDRVRPIVQLPPAALPVGLPLLGPDGRDAFGYPLKYVDMPGVRSMLWHRRFAELSRAFEQLQSDFERDPTCEYWPVDAGDAFDSAEPQLRALLDAWVEATPDSFAPYFARGVHWVAAAYARRGAAYAAETPREDMEAMDRAFARAKPDLERALALRPKLVAAQSVLLRAARAHSGESEARKLTAAALVTCPSCFLVRVSRMAMLEPRWGGSYAAMDAFAAAAGGAPGSKLHVLRGFSDAERARRLRGDKKYDESLAAADRALASGVHWGFLLERAATLRARGDTQRGLADADRAAELRPGYPTVSFDRASLHYDAKHWEQAGRDLLAGLRVDPTDYRGREIYPMVVDGLMYGSWSAHREGRKEDALRMLDLALDLAPDHPEGAKGKAYVVLTSADGGPDDDVPTLEARVRDRPDDFRARQQLDYALVRQRRFAEVAAMWDEYLARHPDDGRARMERAGTYHHLARTAESDADAKRACELGVTEGCMRAASTR